MGGLGGVKGCFKGDWRAEGKKVKEREEGRRRRRGRTGMCIFLKGKGRVGDGDEVFEGVVFSGGVYN